MLGLHTALLRKLHGLHISSKEASYSTSKGTAGDLYGPSTETLYSPSKEAVHSPYKCPACISFMGDEHNYTKGAVCSPSKGAA